MAGSSVSAQVERYSSILLDFNFVNIFAGNHYQAQISTCHVRCNRHCSRWCCCCCPNHRHCWRSIFVTLRQDNITFLLSIKLFPFFQVMGSGGSRYQYIWTLRRKCAYRWYEVVISCRGSTPDTPSCWSAGLMILILVINNCELLERKSAFDYST